MEVLLGMRLGGWLVWVSLMHIKRTVSVASTENGVCSGLGGPELISLVIKKDACVS